MRPFSPGARPQAPAEGPTSVSVKGSPAMTVLPSRLPSCAKRTRSIVFSREYAFTWLPINGLFLKTEFRYSQYGNHGVSVPLTGSIGGVPVTGAALNSQKATEFISTELVYRFNWFGR